MHRAQCIALRESHSCVGFIHRFRRIALAASVSPHPSRRIRLAASVSPHPSRRVALGESLTARPSWRVPLGASLSAHPCRRVALGASLSARRSRHVALGMSRSAHPSRDARIRLDMTSSPCASVAAANASVHRLVREPLVQRDCLGRRSDSWSAHVRPARIAARDFAARSRRVPLPRGDSSVADTNDGSLMTRSTAR